MWCVRQIDFESKFVIKTLHYLFVFSVVDCAGGLFSDFCTVPPISKCIAIDEKSMRGTKTWTECVILVAIFSFMEFRIRTRSYHSIGPKICRNSIELRMSTAPTHTPITQCQIVQCPRHDVAQPMQRREISVFAIRAVRSMSILAIHIVNGCVLTHSS